MRDTVLFSIVIPVYNVEKYIHRCVDSILNQTYKNIEVILVDDGSPDNCPVICDIYAQSDERVRVVHQSNQGLSAARNTGIRMSSGKYVMFVDSDDFISLDACEKISEFTKLDCDILVGDGKSTQYNRALTHKLDIDVCCGCQFLKQALQYDSMPMAAWLYIYKRSFLIDCSLEFKEGILHEDEQFTPRAFLKARTVANTNVSFYFYDIHENSITTKKDMRKNISDFYSTCLELHEIYSTVEDESLKSSLYDTLAEKYLSLFQAGRIYQYGKAFYYPRFVWEHAMRKKTKLKALLFMMSPKLYWYINYSFKKIMVILKEVRCKE